jgi:DNA-binding transcriptional MerR regulator
MATTYRISDLAREFDLTTRAMRFYEDMGLLQPGALRSRRASAACIPAA